jgi:hypothetical protein
VRDIARPSVICTQGIAFGVLTGSLWAFDHRVASVAIAAIALLCALALLAVSSIRFRGDKANTRWRPFLCSFPYGVTGIGTAAAFTQPARALGGQASGEVVYAITLLAALAAAAILLSSLIDWYYTAPALRADRRPCNSSLDDQWRNLTRVWLLHRVIASLMFVGASIGVVALAANHWVTDLNEVVAAALAAAATVLAGFYLTRFPFAMGFLINPPLQVGDKIWLAEPFPLPGRTPPYYVVDISIEGVKLRELSDDGGVAATGGDRSHDRVLELTEAHKLIRRRDAFAGCANTTCAGVNPYCGRRHPNTGSDHFPSPRHD